MVCRILAEHDLKWSYDHSNPIQYAQGGDTVAYRTFENPHVKEMLRRISPNLKWPLGDPIAVNEHRINFVTRAMVGVNVDFVKIAVEYADIMKGWCDSVRQECKFIKVYRPPEDIAGSIERRKIGTFEAGIAVARKRLKLMDEYPGPTVATNMLVDREDWVYSGIYTALGYVGRTLDKAAMMRAIQPEIFHT
jgi:hypothetical protein